MRVLLDPLVMLFFVVLFICLAAMSDLLRWPFRQSPGSTMRQVVQVPEDARAFLFFKRVDINQLGMEGLVLIPGIGQDTAQKIMDYRDVFGFILDIDELQVPQGPLRQSKVRILKHYCMAGESRDSL